jgi:hypothetical protein
MKRAAVHLAGLCLALAGCTSAPPPQQLGGLWSAGEAACAAGVGVRFDADAIRIVHERMQETVFANPSYRVLDAGEPFRVQITYDLPHVPGGLEEPGARGILVITRRPDGALRAVTHNLIDGRTGAARARIGEDPAKKLLSLRPCTDAGALELKGLSAS